MCVCIEVKQQWQMHNRDARRYTIYWKFYLSILVEVVFTKRLISFAFGCLYFCLRFKQVESKESNRARTPIPMPYDEIYIYIYTFSNGKTHEKRISEWKSTRCWECVSLYCGCQKPKTLSEIKIEKSGYVCHTSPLVTFPFLWILYDVCTSTCTHPTEMPYSNEWRAKCTIFAKVSSREWIECVTIIDVFSYLALCV